jgi:acetate kinase
VRVLALNAGSSTFKWTLLDERDRATIRSGEEDWSADDLGRRDEKLRTTLREMLRGIAGFDVVGHRVVHGGRRFLESVVVDRDVRAALEELTALDPVHMRPALFGIDAVSRELPAVTQIATFDTAFHARMPDAAACYALPFEWSERWGLRRFGFHGLSVAYSLERAREILAQTPHRMIVCHLGSGCSVTALLDGRSVDTSMGFSPIDGVVMATRSGSLDPGLLLHLQTSCGVGAADLFEAIQTRSGLLGLSGVSGDLRRVLAAADTGSARARLAYDAFVWSLRRAMGAAAGVLGGVDAIVFTGGIGENSARVRGDVAPALAFAGLRLEDSDRADGGDRLISASDSQIAALVIHAREDLMILDEVARLVGRLPAGEPAPRAEPRT